jgi:hypothetical protein
MKEKLGTWLEESLGRRLRVYAAINRRTVIDVIDAALDSYLPPLADLVSTANSENGQASGHMALEQLEPGNDQRRSAALQ